MLTPTARGVAPVQLGSCRRACDSACTARRGRQRARGERATSTTSAVTRRSMRLKKEATPAEGDSVEFLETIDAVDLPPAPQSEHVTRVRPEVPRGNSNDHVKTRQRTSESPAAAAAASPLPSAMAVEAEPDISALTISAVEV